jgi:hypothetical protein
VEPSGPGRGGDRRQGYPRMRGIDELSDGTGTGKPGSPAQRRRVVTGLLHWDRLAGAGRDIGTGGGSDPAGSVVVSASGKRCGSREVSGGWSLAGRREFRARPFLA